MYPCELLFAWKRQCPCVKLLCRRSCRCPAMRLQSPTVRPTTQLVNKVRSIYSWGVAATLLLLFHCAIVSEGRVKLIPTSGTRSWVLVAEAPRIAPGEHSESGRFSINEDPGRSSPTTSVHAHVRDVVSAKQRYAAGCLWPCCTVHVLVCFLEDFSRVAAE